MKMELKTGKASMNSRMVAIMKDSGKITKYVELENFIFPITGFNTLVSGTTINLMDGEPNMH